MHAIQRKEADGGLFQLWCSLRAEEGEKGQGRNSAVKCNNLRPRSSKAALMGFGGFFDPCGGYERGTASAPKINFFQLRQVRYDGRNKVFARVCALVLATKESKIMQI